MPSLARRGLLLGLTIAPAISATVGLASVARAQDSTSVEETADVCFGAAERAQPLLRQKKLREARALLESCARDECPRVARSDCREWLAEANDAQPSIVIAAHEVHGATGARQVRDVSGIRAVIDDSLVVEDVDSTPIVIDPGRHRLRLERAGVEPVWQEVEIHDGEKARVVDVYWRRPATASARGPVPTSVYVAGGAGLVSGAVGAYFEISGLSQRSTLDASCKPTASCTLAQVDSARTQLRVGDVAIGSGILLLLGSALLYVSRPSPDALDAADTHRDSHEGMWVGAVPGGFVAGAKGNL